MDNEEAGLQVIDISNPANPQRVGYRGKAAAMLRSGVFAFTAIENI
jgi:hypothetical protein